MARIQVIARGVLVAGDRVLLCIAKQGKGGSGYAYLPGGHVEHGEGAAVALHREWLEEIGTAIRVGDPLLFTEEVFVGRSTSAKSSGGDSQPATKTFHELNVVFHVEPEGESAQAYADRGIVSQEDGIDFQWVERASLDAVDVRPVSIKRWLMAYLDGAIEKTPGWRAVGSE